MKARPRIITRYRPEYPRRPRVVIGWRWTACALLLAVLLGLTWRWWVK